MSASGKTFLQHVMQVTIPSSSSSSSFDRNALSHGSLQWLVDEAADKGKKPVNKNEWRLDDSGDGVPQQQNGFDCGMFSIMCADAVADELPLNCYGQADMDVNRRKVCAAILRGYIRY
jgi:Ulp1 family protease